MLTVGDFFDDLRSLNGETVPLPTKKYTLAVRGFSAFFPPLFSSYSCWACCVPASCCAEGVEILLMSSSSLAEPMHSRKLKPELFSLVLIWKVN